MVKIFDSISSIITSTLSDLVMKSSPDIPTTIISKEISNVVASPLKMLSNEVTGYLADNATEKKLFDAVERFHKDFGPIIFSV